MSIRGLLAIVAATASGACAHPGPTLRQLPAVALTSAVARETLISVRPTGPANIPPTGPGYGDGRLSPFAPYTIIVDGRMAARVRTPADTLEFRKLRSVDPKDVESIEVLRESDAKLRYPESVGNAIVIRLTQKHGTSPPR